MRLLVPPLFCAALLSACDSHPGDAAVVATEKTSGRSQTLAQPVPTETRKFRDWLAVCDNGDDCVAFGPATGGQTGWVRVALAAGPEARPTVAAGFWGDAEETAGGSLTLDIDGRAFTAPVASAAEQPFGEVAASDASAVIDAMATGRRMTLSQGQGRVSVSLSGAAAALLWIDERQGRMDSAGALSRRGDSPASAAKAAPPLPSVSAAPAAPQTGLPQNPTLPAAFEQREDVRQCRADTAFNAGFQGDISVDRLGPDQELWGVPCFAGAYNFGYRYFLTGPSGADPRPISFPTSREPTDEVVNGRYLPESRTLVAFNKGRGLGDCGIASTWVWTGRDFALQSESEMRECWGVPADLWPTTWRTR